MNVESLIPQPVSARAQSRGRMPFAFTSRFVVALLIGLLGLIPAWWSPQWIIGMFVWDGLVFAVWFADLLRLPSPSAVEVERQWKEPLSLGRHATAYLQVHNTTHVPLHVSVVDETSLALRDEPPALETAVPAESTVETEYLLQPRSRGDLVVGSVYLRYRTPLGLAERWGEAKIGQSVRVLPDLVRARNYALYLIRSRQIEMEKRRRRQRGIGREFEALREYRQGDEMRTIHWPATARRHELITRTYQTERSQPVWIVLDAGRLLRAQVYDAARGLFVSKLDYAVDAALALAQVATQSGDRVGLLAYGRSIQRSVGMGRGPQHIRAVLNALAEVKGESAEADHTLAARTLLRTQTQRALVIWVTDFAETATVPEVIDHAAMMTRRHLVVFAAVNQPDLNALIQTVPDSEAEMYRYAAALEVVERREKLMRRLRQQGVLAMDLTPGQLTDSLLNQYLAIKDRGAL